MNISITPELEKFIHAKVKSGRYSSASEVVREALRLLEEREAFNRRKREWYESEIQKGLDSEANEPMVSAEELKEHMKTVKEKFFREHPNDL